MRLKTDFSVARGLIFGFSVGDMEHCRQPTEIVICVREESFCVTCTIHFVRRQMFLYITACPNEWALSPFENPRILIRKELGIHLA